MLLLAIGRPVGLVECVYVVHYVLRVCLLSLRGACVCMCLFLCIVCV